MEYDTPSRFIRDIDPALLSVDGDKPASSKNSRRSFGKSGYSGELGYSGPASRFQNPRPVAKQFVADPKPRMIPVRREAPVSQSAAIGNVGLKEGNVIEHQRFGLGTVIRVEGSGENTKATVAFKNTGTKQLLLKFAKYTIVG
jgi:DNA helicase-2/ATP-dependent DNA helicase PcrA